MFLTVKDLSISYGKKKIIDSVSLDIPRGSFVGILGPNGSGKSTLLKSIYRVLKPSGGTIYLNGEDISTLTYKQSAKQIAVVSQHNFFNFDFTAKEVVMMGRSPHKRHMERDTIEDFEIADRSLAKVDMKDFSDRIFSTLSGGEQQRVILARALAQETECLILDEPTNHLDIKHRLHVLQLVKNMGVTIIAAIHELGIAANFTDKIYVLKDGKVCYQGKPETAITADMIKNVYGVNAKIFKDEDGETIISYKQNQEISV